MSGRYKDDSPIHDELMDKLVKIKHANVAILSCRQFIFGLFHQDIHSWECADTHQMVMGTRTPDHTNLATQFGHMKGGYDGYTWSTLYCEEMFQTVFTGIGVLDYNSGMKFMFGREPNSDAFFRSLGLVLFIIFIW